MTRLLLAEDLVPVVTESGEKCVPFVHEGKLITHCVVEPGGEEDGEEAWCATAVDSEGHVIKKGKCPSDWREWLSGLALTCEFGNERKDRKTTRVYLSPVAKSRLSPLRVFLPFVVLINYSASIQ